MFAASPASAQWWGEMCDVVEGGGRGHHGDTRLQDGVGGAGQGGGSGGGLQTEAARVRRVSCLIKRMRNIRDNIRSSVLVHNANTGELLTFSRHLNFVIFSW